MKQFYIRNGKWQEGPLSAEELMQKGINGKTMVWCEGMPEWVEAQSVPELKELLQLMPPPFGKSPRRSKLLPIAGKKIFKSLLVLLCVIGIVAIISFASIKISNYLKLKTPPPNTGIQKRQVIWVDSLMVSSMQGSIDKNAITQKNNILIRGDVINTARVCSYKDFLVEVHFLSRRNNVLLDTKKYSISDTARPVYVHGIFKDFDVDTPPGCDSIAPTLLSATPFVDSKNN